MMMLADYARAHGIPVGDLEDYVRSDPDPIAWDAPLPLEYLAACADGMARMVHFPCAECGTALRGPVGDIRRCPVCGDWADAPDACDPAVCREGVL